MVMMSILLVTGCSIQSGYEDWDWDDSDSGHINISSISVIGYPKEYEWEIDGYHYTVESGVGMPVTVLVETNVTDPAAFQWFVTPNNNASFSSYRPELGKNTNAGMINLTAFKAGTYIVTCVITTKDQTSRSKSVTITIK